MGGRAGQVVVYDLKQGRTQTVQSHKHPVTTLVFSDDGYLTHMLTHSSLVHICVCMGVRTHTHTHTLGYSLTSLYCDLGTLI